MVKLIDKRLGWSIGGKYEIQNKRIKLLNNNTGAAFLSNDISVISERVEIEVDFQFKEILDKDKKKRNAPGEEAIMFSFSNQPFNTQNFNSDTLETDISGLGVILYRPRNASKGTVAYLKYFQYPGRYNLLKIYNENTIASSRVSCLLYYGKNSNKLKFNIDFKERRFSMLSGSKVCFNFNLSEQQMVKPKVVFSISIASGNNTITFGLNYIKIFKLAESKEASNAFQNASSFFEETHKLMPSYGEETSILNLMENNVK